MIILIMIIVIIIIATLTTVALVILLLIRVIVTSNTHSSNNNEPRFGCSGMWCLRMWGLNIICHRPSKVEGVGTSRLKLIWVRGFTP